MLIKAGLRGREGQASGSGRAQGGRYIPARLGEFGYKLSTTTEAHTFRALGLARVSASDEPIPASWSRRPASNLRREKTQPDPTSSSPSGPNAKRPNSSSRICHTRTRVSLSTRRSSHSQWEANGTAEQCIKRRRCRGSSRRRVLSSNLSDACFEPRCNHITTPRTRVPRQWLDGEWMCELIK